MKPDLSKHWKLLTGGLILVLAVVALGRCTAGTRPETAASETHSSETETQWWTCSMHPQIKLPKPGKCPICGMDLIPLKTGREDHPRELTLGAETVKLLQLETAPVERKFVETDVRMVGKVDFDETRTAFITARIPGRLDRLFVDYTGVQVRKGDHMASIYSPELLSAQEELLQAIKSVKSLEQSESSIVRNISQSTVDAVREKLRLWGLLPEQIQDIETRGTAIDNLTLYSPVSGVVIHKNAQEGIYVKTGDSIYTVADLSRVWVQLEAYESDLPWLRYGQNVTFTTEALPGETFEGTVAFIDPVLNAATRTVNVRVNVDNPQQKLKPGMFVRAVAHPRIAEDGKVANPSLAGKWISPMHPEIVKDEPGSCDVCGMPLVPAEELGYVTEDATAPLVIPATAPLITGTRAVVYIEVPNREAPTYEGREITLGPRAGDFYIVHKGLAEGERVVTQGAFKLDAELQIRAKPSMMSMSHRDMPMAPQLQTHCPVMGGEINKELFTDYNGMRIYFCCSGCQEKFLADPEKYIEQINAKGEEPEMIHEH
ncbi:MAG: efflux RND transporter periplasmic adaptor subunit [Kiritimatiellales bacterium]